MRELREALLTFVDCIDGTGGVIRDRKGYYRPVGDTDWIDLGDAYIQACTALGREPVVDAEYEEESP